MDHLYVCLAQTAKDSPSLRSMLPFVLMAALLIWVVWVGQRRKMKLREKDNGLTPAALDRRNSLQHAMEELQINIMEFGRDVEARLDTKMHALEILIRDADERIKRLEELKGRASSGGGEIPPIHAEIYRLADQGQDKIEIARRTGVAPGEVELILGLRKSRGAM